jgi:hypothetical protein
MVGEFALCDGVGRNCRADDFQRSLGLQQHWMHPVAGHDGHQGRLYRFVDSGDGRIDIGDRVFRWSSRSTVSVGVDGSSFQAIRAT